MSFKHCNYVKVKSSFSSEGLHANPTPLLLLPFSRAQSGRSLVALERTKKTKGTPSATSITSNAFTNHLRSAAP
jgi:hypothetical protein